MLTVDVELYWCLFLTVLGFLVHKELRRILFHGPHVPGPTVRTLKPFLYNKIEHYD